MSAMETSFKPQAEFVRINAGERARETALRERFATFWANTTGSPRSIYDAFIAGTPVAADVAIEQVDGNGVQGYFIKPQQAKTGEAILFLHGGGYFVGSAQSYRGFVSQIVSRTKVPALVVDYPLAPEASLPAAPNAARKAWRHLADMGFDRLAVVGDSAGGGLSLVTLSGLIQRPEGPAPIAGVVFSPWADLAFTGASMTDPSVVDPLIAAEYLQQCATQYRGAYDARDPLASPLFGDLKGLPPLLIQVGTDERLLDDSRQYADRAAKAGVPVELQIFEGMHHVFQLDVSHLQTSRDALERAARFLRTQFDRC